jgi:hypothetical protein
MVAQQVLHSMRLQPIFLLTIHGDNKLLVTTTTSQLMHRCSTPAAHSVMPDDQDLMGSEGCGACLGWIAHQVLELLLAGHHPGGITTPTQPCSVLYSITITLTDLQHVTKVLRTYDHLTNACRIAVQIDYQSMR